MTTNADEQIRADFDAWLLTLGLHLGNHERQLMRLAYQAGRAALQLQKPEPNDLMLSGQPAASAEPTSGLLKQFFEALDEAISKDRANPWTGAKAARYQDRTAAWGRVHELRRQLLDTPAAQAQPVAFAKDGVLFWHGEHAAWRGFNGDLYLAAQAQPVVNQQLTTAARDVLAERQRQVTAEGWTTEHDDSHHTGEIALAAGCYAMYAHHPDYYGTGPRENRVPRMWPWAEKWWKQAPPRRMLVKAGALILAEIERIDRARRIEGEGE